MIYNKNGNLLLVYILLVHISGSWVFNCRFDSHSMESVWRDFNSNYAVCLLCTWSKSSDCHSIVKCHQSHSTYLVEQLSWLHETICVRLSAVYGRVSNTVTCLRIFTSLFMLPLDLFFSILKNLFSNYKDNMSSFKTLKNKNRKVIQILITSTLL